MPSWSRPCRAEQARAAEAGRAAEEQARAAEEQARAAEEQARAAEEQARAAEEQARAAEAPSLPFGLPKFRALFSPIAQRFAMQWYVTDTGVNKRVVLMASKQSHCLSDLLYRWRSGELAFDIPCVLSNHDDLRGYVQWHGIRYLYLPVDQHDKAPHFAAVRRAVEEACADAVVLARYMQILPPDLCALYPGRIINIHHSFLPSFIGAKPYHQASERGVKLIGATCHYVTSELDAGPIIEQDVVRVNHHNTVEDMVRLGKDVEKTVLARGLRYHLEDRVLVHGNKTVVFA
jgi:formyltetrahydrofolate deformylase